MEEVKQQGREAGGMSPVRLGPPTLFRALIGQEQQPQLAIVVSAVARSVTSVRYSALQAKDGRYLLWE
jgi:hypothetical protein